MKIKLVKLIGLSLLILFASCTDDSPLELSESSNERTLKGNQSTEFLEEAKLHYENDPEKIDKISKHLGLISWENARVYETAEERICFVPTFKNNDEKTRGVIVVYEHDIIPMSFSHLRRNQLNKLKNRNPNKGVGNGSIKLNVDFEFMATQFMMFDKDIFDYYDCTLMDNYVKELGKKGKSLKTSCYFNYEPVSYTDYGVCVGTPIDPYAYCSHDYTTFNYGWVLYCSPDDANYTGTWPPQSSGNGSLGYPPTVELTVVDDQVGGIPAISWGGTTEQQKIKQYLDVLKLFSIANDNLGYNLTYIDWRGYFSGFPNTPLDYDLDGQATIDGYTFPIQIVPYNGVNTSYWAESRIDNVQLEYLTTGQAVFRFKVRYSGNNVNLNIYVNQQDANIFQQYYGL